MTAEIGRLLAEIGCAADEAEIAGIVRRANELLAVLPPRQREQAAETLGDAIRERRQCNRTPEFVCDWCAGDRYDDVERRGHAANYGSECEYCGQGYALERRLSPAKAALRETADKWRFSKWSPKQSSDSAQPAREARKKSWPSRKNWRKRKPPSARPPQRPRLP
jgi:hypothetical protein